MINFFGTNRVVPNGYIYTSHKGSEYIYFEGIWFNHKNMKMIDPNKAPQMNEAAKKQIIEHNCNNKQMIGETFTFTGKTYTYVGKERFTENGVLTESKVLTELLADEERVYSVSRDTLNKEWNELKFSIIPPHAEDISIPPGLVVNGFKFIPRGQRFQDMSTGSYAEPAIARKLYDAGIRMVRADAGNHTLVPINSTLMTGNSKLQYNGTDFCDNDGNPVVSGASADKIISAYTKFVQSNPQDFPSLAGDNTKEQRFGANVRPKVGSDLVQKRDQVTEAEESSAVEKKHSTDDNETSNIIVPDGFAITSKAGVKYIKKAGQWISSQTKKAMNSSAAKSIERAAESKIKKHNETSPVKIGDTWTSSKGKEYKYVGDDRFISTDGKLVPKSSAEKIMAQLSNKAPEETQEVTKEVPTEIPQSSEEHGEPEQVKPQQAKPTQPEVDTEEKPSGNSELETLAQQIKAHPKARKITVLMTRGDKVSLLAADLILAGKEQDAIKILKALNSSDE